MLVRLFVLSFLQKLYNRIHLCLCLCAFVPKVFPSSVGFLQIQSDGKCVYSSDPLVTSSPKRCTPNNQTGVYTMSHTDKVACDITDDDGNHFQVSQKQNKEYQYCLMCCLGKQ